MAVDTGYVANNAGLVTLTLPDTAALGKVVAVAGLGAGGWLVFVRVGKFVRKGLWHSGLGFAGI